MAVKNILPTTNLEYSDIRDTLNANGGSVNNNMGSLFTEEAKIDKWAKYKPVRFNEAFPNYDTYWKAQNGYCGLVPAKCGPDYITDSQNLIWEYELPRGGESEPFRLGDFRGYNPKARPKYTPIFPSSAYVNDSFDVVFSEINADETSLDFKDLTDFINDKFYISCIARVPYSGSSGSYQYAYGSTAEVSQGGNLSLRISTQGSEFKEGKNVELFLFLSDQPFVGGVPSNAMLYAYPDSEFYNRKGTVLLQAKPTFVDRWKITSWTITEHYNYIDFVAQATVSNDSEVNVPGANDLRYSHSIQSEYETWNVNRSRFESGQINVSSMVNKKFTISGRVSLPTTVYQSYEGILTIEWTNGVVWDALGGERVKWTEGVDAP